MLPLSITRHPYFQEDLEEPKATEFLLNNTDKVNVLFCKTKNNKEFLLCYKSSFRGNSEVRVLKLIYNFNQRRIESSSLGNVSTLYAVCQQLPKFLNGFADGQFNPLPAYKKSIRTKLFLAQSESLASPLSPLSKDVILDNIFTKLDMNSLFNAMQVSKSWYLLVYSEIPLILKRHDQAENIKIAKHKEMVQFIFDFVKKELKPNPEGEGKAFKRLTYNEFVLSEPQWYGSSIICRIDRKESEKRYLLIEPNSIRWMSIDEPVSDDTYEKLLDACKLGENSLNQF